MRGRRRTSAVLAALAAALAAAPAAPAAAPASCGSDGTPDRVFTGELDASRQGSFVMVPFDVPAGTTQVRVRYCHDEPEPGGPRAAHTLDLGLYEPRRDGHPVWGMDEFRGWSGSGYSDVTVTPQGFSSEAQYELNPKAHVPGRTTRSFRPGPIPPGKWAAELGLANITSQGDGDADGGVAYRVEVMLDDDPAFSADPYEPSAGAPEPARRDSGWYAGDLHVHAEHSGDAEATMTETFDFAFRSQGRGGAGLDFISLTDHNTDSAWPELARYRGDHPGRLVIPGEEVTTYRGHANAHAPGSALDYRTGPILLRQPGGSLSTLRGARPPRGFLAAARGHGGLTQINHPTLFPSPPFPPNLCRGCEWEYSPTETDYRLVDGIEVATGPADLNGPSQPGPNPFTVTAIAFWERALDLGHRIAAVGGSDSHRAGRVEEVTQSPVGEPTTVVFARELSARGIRDGVRAGHTYVKIGGNDRPDLRFEARAVGSTAPPAIMGDTVRGREIELKARVLGGDPTSSPGGAYTLTVLKDGRTRLRTVPVTSDPFRLRLRVRTAGRYRLQLDRGSSIEAVSTPIYVTGTGGGPGGGGGGAGECTIRGTSGNDVLLGTPGRDVICAGAGNDVVNGAGGDDVVRGAHGDDVLRGEEGRDRLSGGAGDDTLSAGPGGDRLTGGSGRDVLSGHDHGDRLEARDGRPRNDVANGGRGADACVADVGDVRISC